jgi:signal transduction histidine kinase
MVLIVDDNPGNLFTLRTLLELNNFTVETASSGEEALKIVLKKDCSLIILDVQMPGMDGFEVAEAVSGLSKSKDIPIIFLSAVNIEKRFISKGYASGAIDYMTKPFDADILVLKVKTLYRLSKQTTELKLMQQSLLTEIETRKKAEALLFQSHELLEQKVKERTLELDTTNSALTARNEELQQYAYLASHDLQEPLRKISTYSSMLYDKFNSKETAEIQVLEKIMKAADRMRELIQDLLLYSQLSEVHDFKQVELNEVVEGALLDLELAIKDKKAVVRFNKLPSVEAIPGQLRQVFMNLINNAIKYSRQDLAPMIIIEADIIATKAFDAALNNNGGFCRIAVSDNGIGINEKYAEKIFAIFQRLHGRSQYEGTGIGLAIVRKIIEKHHGIIKANGKEGDGTTITFILPLHQPLQPVKE